MALQVPLEGFELVAVFEADDVLRRYRLLDGNSRFQFDLRLNA